MITCEMLSTIGYHYGTKILANGHCIHYSIFSSRQCLEAGSVVEIVVGAEVKFDSAASESKVVV